MAMEKAPEKALGKVREKDRKRRPGVFVATGLQVSGVITIVLAVLAGSSTLQGITAGLGLIGLGTVIDLLGEILRIARTDKQDKKAVVDFQPE